MLELRLLNYFLVLSEELHYTKAAERLHISQPTLSNQIKLLEDTMGAKLFKHEGKKTLLTEEGQILKDHVYKIFFSIEQTKAAIKNHAGEARTKIKIGASGCHLILSPCSDFNKLHPDISLSLEERSSKTIFENVRQGKLDLGVVFSSLEDSAIHSEVLTLEPHFVVAPITSKIASYESVKLEDLINEPMVLLSSNSSTRKNINKAFTFINHVCNPTIEVANLSCISLVENSNNITILPKSYTKSIHNNNLKIIPISDYPPRQTINLIYRKELFLDPVLSDLLDIIREFHKN